MNLNIHLHNALPLTVFSFFDCISALPVWLWGTQINTSQPKLKGLDFYFFLSDQIRSNLLKFVKFWIGSYKF